MTYAEESITTAPEGPRPAYIALSPYGALGAIGWTLLALVVGAIAFVAALIIMVAVRQDGLLSGGMAAFDALSQLDQMAAALYGMLAMQLAAVGMAFLAASRRGYRAVDVLALRRPRSFWPYIWGPLLLAVVAIAVGNLLYYFFPDDTMQDMKLWLPLINSEYWWLVFVVAAIGAPLSEEIWFRGFLLPSFARTFAGARPGRGPEPTRIVSPAAVLAAAALTAGMFALAHAYSPQGALTVLALGLTLSFILWRSGSLWAAIVAHGLYNLAVFSYVKWVMPVTQTQV